MDAIAKLKTILVQPSRFFSQLREKDLWTAFQYYAVLALLYALLGGIVSWMLDDYFTELFFKWIGIPFVSPSPLSLHTQAAVFIVFTLFTYIMTLVGSFISAAVLHVWILIFGGKESYIKTYQLNTYSRMPYFLFGWIPFVSIFAWIYTLGLFIIGTEKLHKIPRRKAVLMYVIPVAIILLLGIGMLLFFVLYFPWDQIAQTMQQAVIQQ